MVDGDEMRKKYLVIKPQAYAVFGFMSLILFYFLILTVANSFEHAVYQFFDMWYWIIILSFGFGTQVGLYVYTKGFAKINSYNSANGAMAVSGGASTVSMAACCAHHITDFLPILGLSFAAVFLVKYQLLFIMFGVVSNLFGIIMMLGIIQKHKLFEVSGIFSKIFKIDMGILQKGSVVFGIIILIVTFLTLI